MAWPKLEDRNLDRRCTAPAQRQGRRCGRYAIKGGSVCPIHGGSLPSVKAKAMRKLEELVEQAINEAEKLLIDPLLEPADKIKTIDTVFDRTFYPTISRR